ITHPTNAMINITISRGNKCANSRTISCVACASSAQIISRMIASLSAVAKFEQVGLGSLKLATQVFDVVFHVFRRTAAVFYQKCEDSPAVERRQGLDNVIAAYDRFVISRCKLINRAGPQFGGITKIFLAETRNMLKCGQGWR